MALSTELADYFLQHFAQPAASVQHLAHVAGSLQQPPSHFIAGLAQALSWLQQVEQPVVIRIPAAKVAASSIIVFIVVVLFGSWMVSCADGFHTAIGKSFASPEADERSQSNTDHAGRNWFISIRPFPFFKSRERQR